MSEISIARFEAIVEGGLQNHFGRSGSYPEFAGQLSIYPDRVGRMVASETLESQCDGFSRELRQVGIRRLGLQTHLAMSDEENADHVYLIPDERYGLPDVIVDPTVGQYVHGHNNVFVGHRETLKGIVVHQTGAGKRYSLVEPSELIEPEEFALYKAPPKFFQRKWGDTSRRI